MAGVLSASSTRPTRTVRLLHAEDEALSRIEACPFDEHLHDTAMRW